MGMLALMGGSFVLYLLLRKPVEPPPPEVARNPLLLQGRSIYLSRCATCHGFDGRGDGPLAGSLLGPSVDNLSDGKWKHGNKPDEVLAVISRGVSGTRMDGWSQILDPPQIRAVTAYVFFLAKQPVPQELRKALPD
jgi:cytochrome c oxidase cbb3-type subunit III